MRKWFVRERDGHEIYLTDEQWEHIIDGHRELRNHVDDVLSTVRRRRRQQQSHDPQAYVYRQLCDTLRLPFNGILVVVIFRFEDQENSGTIANNFIC